jgi:hypothetical protein
MLNNFQKLDKRLKPILFALSQLSSSTKLALLCELRKNITKHSTMVHYAQCPLRSLKAKQEESTSIPSESKVAA